MKVYKLKTRFLELVSDDGEVVVAGVVGYRMTIDGRGIPLVTHGGDNVEVIDIAPTISISVQAEIRADKD